MVGILITIVLFVSILVEYFVHVSLFSCIQIVYMCYWPHTLKPREDRYYLAPRSVDLLNVSTAVVD